MRRRAADRQRSNWRERSRKCTSMDASIIGEPSSTKKAETARDAEMHQTRKGQQWYFGVKLHIAVDSQSGLAHSAVATAANIEGRQARQFLRVIRPDSLRASCYQCSRRGPSKAPTIAGMAMPAMYQIPRKGAAISGQ